VLFCRITDKSGSRTSKTAREFSVYNRTRQTFLSFRVKVCDSILDRVMGLLGQRSLLTQGGIWIVPGNAAHATGIMMLSFDLVWINQKFKVVRSA
jgi:uncharacterized membrane protein (UPF0127 family)